MGKLKLRRKPGGHRGPLPTEPRHWADWALEKRPSDQWLVLHQAEIDAGATPEPGDEDMVVGLNLYGHLALPSDKVPPNLWKQGKVLLFTAWEGAYHDFRTAVDADIASQIAPTDHRAELAGVAAKALKAKRR